jgi:hypothetical protein
MTFSINPKHKPNVLESCLQHQGANDLLGWEAEKIIQCGGILCEGYFPEDFIHIFVSHY